MALRGRAVSYERGTPVRGQGFTNNAAMYAPPRRKYLRKVAHDQCSLGGREVLVLIEHCTRPSLVPARPTTGVPHLQENAPS